MHETEHAAGWANSGLSNSFPMLPTLVAILLTIYFMVKWLHSSTHQLKHIPTVGGSSNVILSYFSALRYYTGGHRIIQEGYDKHYGIPFKVSTMSKWLVVISGSEMIEDVGRAPDQFLSFYATLVEILRTDYTMPPSVLDDPYHLQYLRAPLTKCLANHHAHIQDEISCAIDDLFQIRQNGRNSGYLQLSADFTADVFLSSLLLNMFPKILHPLLGFLSARKVNKMVEQFESYICPLVEASLQQNDQKVDSESSDGSNLFSWLVQKMQKPGKTLDISDLARRILVINFVTIGSTAAVLADALFNLAKYPEYAAPMREEIEEIVNIDGWTQDSIAKMRKVDSFVRETLRTGTGGATGNRKVLKDFTFSNGISLPAGTSIAFATHSIHHDAKHYDFPTAFRGFRFADPAPGEDNKSPREPIVSLSSEHLSFGTGRHACPGRFLAAYMIKSTLAQIILNFEVEYANPSHRGPKLLWSQNVSIPDGKTQLLFKKRI